MRAEDRLVARTVRRGGAWLVVLAVAMVGAAMLQLLLPYVLGRTVDALLLDAPGSHRWLAGCGLLVAGMVACETLGIWAAGASSAHASAWLRNSLVRQVLDAGPAMTRKFPHGDLLTRVGLNAEEVGRAPESVITAAALLIPTIGALVALALIDVWLPVTLLAGLVLTSFALRAFLRDTTSLAGSYQRVQGEIATRLSDALTGIRTIAAAGTTEAEARRVLGPLPRLRGHGMGLWRANARAGVQTGLVVPLLEVTVLGVGGVLLASGDLTVGELYAAVRYVVLGAGLSGALGHLGRLARARSAAARLTGLFAVDRVPHGTRSLPAGPGTLEFRSVTLSPDGAPGLHDVSAVVPGGSVTAVVGRSGSGKSLLAALAARLRDPDDGSVLLDGVPLTELSRTELRRAIGLAFECPALVGGTLAEAITLGRPGAGAELIQASAGAASADGFVRRLPQGYATPLDDAPMSGGERQRLGLARAFAQGDRLLVLDDATSSLDTVTERQVTEALTRHLGDRTRLVIAHRAATAAQADQVIWLENGRIRAQAPHRTLWRDPGYRAAFRPAAVEEAS